MSSVKVNPAIARDLGNGSHFCQICQTAVKTKVWTAHASGRQHRDNIQRLKSQAQPPQAKPIPKRPMENGAKFTAEPVAKKPRGKGAKRGQIFGVGEAMKAVFSPFRMPTIFRCTQSFCSSGTRIHRSRQTEEYRLFQSSRRPRRFFRVPGTSSQRSQREAFGRRAGAVRERSRPDRPQEAPERRRRRRDRRRRTTSTGKGLRRGWGQLGRLEADLRGRDEDRRAEEAATEGGSARGRDGGRSRIGVRRGRRSRRHELEVSKVLTNTNNKFIFVH
ncbi:hypothetical protein L596_023644 [Steinernema carpocapsae]|uniref:U1-type domain-containing protein n=1 Tax=Steinernema carpocapsae TaxID=34508 RepID=A0A4U5ME98_STECR|nr:hypothetical protein L596_023644 [Steinernema carpocapsae]